MRGVWMHGLIAAASLLLAYRTWTREDEVTAPAGQVEVMACAADEFESVSVETATYHNTVAPSGPAPERTYWVTSERKPKQPDAPSNVTDAGVGDDAGPSAREPDVPEPPQRFVANEKLEGYLKRLMPLRARRSLGVIPAERAGEFGLDDVDTRFDLRCGGQVLELEVGGRTYGSGQRYLRRKDNGEVLLMDGSLVQDMQSARYKFKQTELHRFALDAVDLAHVSASGQARDLLHRQRNLPDQARWVDATEPDKRNELFGNWFSRVGRLRARDYLAPDAAPGADLDPSQGPPGEPEPVVEIAYGADGKPLGKLELVRVRQGDSTHYYARSETTRAWVSLHDSSARLVAEDAPLVVGAEQPAATDAPSPAPEAGPASGMPAGHPPLAPTGGHRPPPHDHPAHTGH